MKENFKFKILGLSITAFLFITNCIFIFLIANTKLLILKYIFIASAVLLCLTAIVFALSLDIRKKVRTVIAIVLAIVILVLESFGGYYIHLSKSTLEGITTPSNEIVEICTYVRIDDPAQVIADTKGYTFGILEVQDRQSTDKVLSDISQLLNSKLTIKTYSGVEELIKALIDSEEINVMVLNKSFLELLYEIEGHENDSDLIREIHKSLNEVENSAPPVLSKNENIFTIYISGIDCYGKITRRSRSDVNILATVNVTTGEVLLVSTPRDSYVPLSISNGIPDKLTNAGIYGINVSKDTLGMLYDIDIDYYFRINFDGFTKVINSLDGITVNSDYKFSSAGYSFKKGENFLNGDEALAFARARKAVPNGDRQRGKHQMAVIKGVINKAMSSAIIKNYPELLNSLAGTFETNMSYETLSKLVQYQLKNNTNWNVTTYSVNGTGTHKKPYSQSTKAYVLVLAQDTIDKAKELINAVKNGEKPVV